MLDASSNDERKLRTHVKSEGLIEKLLVLGSRKTDNLIFRFFRNLHPTSSTPGPFSQLNKHPPQLPWLPRHCASPGRCYSCSTAAIAKHPASFSRLANPPLPRPTLHRTSTTTLPQQRGPRRPPKAQIRWSTLSPQVVRPTHIPRPESSQPPNSPAPSSRPGHGSSRSSAGVRRRRTSRRRSA